ncbi:MAG: putative 7-carboxy-7-deazaguanine synthase QueE [Lachnospiraceae bacterium]|nr:putative 7-carboxy-7-deazaguanine synthase QueE [Lachnospiraceae bacterium]
MKVVEMFTSINGEGTRAGELAVFVRFKGCNLRCSYCDTMWANEGDCPYEEKGPEEILQEILASGIRNVTLTGGEPLLQKEMKALLHLLLQTDLRVEIETNGAVRLAEYCQERPVFTMDYKLPSSGCESQMILENMELLEADDTVKFVVGTAEDLESALELIRFYDLTNHCHVYFSPVFGSIEPVQIVDFMMEHKLNDVRLQIQMHKVIWDPNQRGV